jgi:putative FmdB family regulatory protein
VPIYEYVCMGCEEHFEELVRLDDAAPPCPSCGQLKAERQFSVFAMHGASQGASQGAPSQPSFGGGGCCGGACGSCG